MIRASVLLFVLSVGGDVWAAGRGKVLDLRSMPKDVVGLAAPGMPAGSPGMETGGRADRYDVIAFSAGGKTRVFASHG